MKTLFIEARSNIDIKIPKIAYSKLPTNIALFTTVQHIHKIRDVKNQLIKEIGGNSSFDLPESVINREMNNIIEKFKINMGIENKDINELFENGLLKKEKFLTQVRNNAVENIKSTLILLEIAKLEEIKPSEEKYKNIIKSYADSNKMKIDDIEKTFESNGTKNNIETELVIDEASDFIYDNAEIKKKKVTFDEFIKE